MTKSLAALAALALCATAAAYTLPPVKQDKPRNPCTDYVHQICARDVNQLTDAVSDLDSRTTAVEGRVTVLEGIAPQPQCTSPTPTPSIATGPTPSTGAVGTSVTLTGEFSGVYAVTFGGRAAAFEVAPGCRSLTATIPAASSTGTFTLTNTVASVISDTFYVSEPLSAPVISSFSAGCPAGIASGQSCLLSWSVSGSTSLSINQGVGAVTGSSKSVSPTVTTAYTLTATNSAGSVTASATVVVLPGAPACWNMTPASGPVGTAVAIQGANLSASTGVSFNGHAAAVTYNPAGNNGQGELTATVPAAATTGTVTIANAGGSDTCAAFTVTTPGSCDIDAVAVLDFAANTGTAYPLTSAMGSATTIPEGCTIDTSLTWAMASGYTAVGYGTISQPGGTYQFNAPALPPTGGISKIAGCAAAKPSVCATATISFLPFESVYFNDVTVAASSTVRVCTASVTAPTGSGDSLDYTWDDDTSSTWPKAGTQPTCSTGGTTCGSNSSSSCAIVSGAMQCCTTYQAPACGSATCSFRGRATSHLVPTGAKDWFNVTVTGSGASLAVSPTSAAVSTGGTASFSASGGTAPYSWTATAGSFSPTTGASTTYTAPASAQSVTVTVTDNVSATATSAVTVNAASGDPLAFPGCQGSGCKTRGGFASGSTVYRVTNTNTSGSGSLKACVTASGPRVCLIEVAGTLSDHFAISNGSITIDGRSAPGGGLQITSDSNSAPVFDVRASDVVVRGLKIRPTWDSSGARDGSNKRGIKIYNDYGSVTRMVFDHNSIQYANATPIDLWVHPTSSCGVSPYTPASEMTFGWNLISDAFYISGDANMNRAFIWGCGSDSCGNRQTCNQHQDKMTNVDLHHNLIASTGYRNPEFKGASGRITNNYLYNWGRHGVEIVGTAKTDVIGNIFQSGPLTFNETGEGILLLTSPTAGNSSDQDWTNAQSVSQLVYMTGNISDMASGDTGSTNWSSGIASGYGVSQTPRTTRLPASSSGTDIPPENAADAKAAIIAAGGAGASYRLDCGGNIVNRRDTLDASIITYESTSGGPSEVPVNAGDQSLPTITGVTSACANASDRDNTSCVCKDTDGDGIPDYFEHAWTTSSDTSMSATGHSLDATFTDLEMYLSGLKGKTSY